MDRAYLPAFLLEVNGASPVFGLCTYAEKGNIAKIFYTMIRYVHANVSRI